MSKMNKKEPLGLNTSKMNSILSASFTKKANKSMVNPDGLDFIQLSQSEVNFINTEPNEVYEISFTVRNVGQKSTKLKLRKPKSDSLSVSIDKDMNLAPGLEKKITVTFNSETNDELRDNMYLYCQDQFDIEVPICVFPNLYHLTYEPFINFGFLKVGSTKEHEVKIRNKGNNVAEIKLESQVKGAKAIVEPCFLTIQPNSQEKATLYLTSEEISEFQGFIQITPQNLGESNIEITGSFCEHSRYISDVKGKEINQLHIQPLFGGQKKSASFYLINNTPKACQFRIIRKRGSNNEQQMVLLTPQEFGRDDEEKNICFSQKEGLIEPYSKKLIMCHIVAKIDEHDQQLFCNYVLGRIKLLPYENKEWLYMVSTTFKDEDSARNLLIRGESVIPKLSISSIFFKFGDCNIRSKHEKILKIENLSDQSVTINLEKSQNYSFFPETLEIAKDSFKQVIVKFFPKVVGDLHQICYLKAASFSFPIKMFGKGIFTKELANKTSISREGSFAIDQSRGIEMNVADLDKSLNEHEISIINEKSIYIEENSKISTTNFDSSTFAPKNKMDCKTTIKKRTLKNKNGKEIAVDIQNFNADEQVQEYPGLGRGSQQDRIVSRQLSLNQFKNIPVGPVILDFGQIFVSSAQKKTFHICNLNTKPISIQTETKGNPQFEKSSKQVQVLPGQSHGGLKIIYEAFQQGPFKHPLQYIINGRHYFEILAVGTAILATIVPSKTQFKFYAGEDDHTFDKKQIFTLNNTYPYEVQYQFKSQKDSLFKVSPQKGKIQPKGKETVCISHSFLGISEGGGKVEQNIKIKVKNGKNIDLKCTSIVPECHVVCKPNECNFKEISICKQHQMKFSIKNSSKNFTIFKIVPNKDIEQEVKIVASKTILAADEIAEVNVKLMSPKQQVIDSGLTIIVRGGRKIFISIKANIIIPKIKIEGDEINFGTMPVGGNPNSKQITLVNESSIPAELQLVLANDSFLSRCLSIKCENNELRTVVPGKEIKQRKAKTFQIKIMKKCKTQVCLQFSPQEVKDYKFTLPLYLIGNSQANPSLQKSVLCRSLRNRLLVNHKELDFGKTIIEQSLDNLPKNIVFTLSNPQEEDIEWWASEKNLEPFSLEIKKGIIKGNSQIKIKAFFYSESPGSFQKQLQFFVNNSDFEPSRPYLKLPIKATANYPEIYFDRPYMILPTVRLNQESVGKFQILNGGYENLNLKHVISQEYSNIDLNVKYVNGSNLGITKKSITVVVSFKSDKPISFTLKIEFYDNHNRVFSIFVSGTADNSLYVLPQENWLVAEELGKSASFLTTFLNSVGFVEDILYNFPNCLSDNDYENFNKLLEHYSPQVQRLEKLRPNSKKPSTIQENYEYLSEVIKILKSDGAFLSQIRPQFLMSEGDYVEILKNKSQNIRIFSNYKIPSNQEIAERNLKSWIILIYQILRVYSKVPIKKKQNTGDIWSQMMQKQRTIINWLEQSYQTQAGLTETKSCNELNDLSNGQMLSALITKYTNIKILEGYGKPCTIFKEKQKRCKKIVEIFSQIGIAAGARVQDLLRSKPIQMLVFLERLYLILPYYLQKGEPIIFSCAIGQSLTKSIQIKNPFKLPVTYTAKIEGSKAYVIENEQQFEIESKQRHEVQVKYISNIDIDKTNATLTLTGKTTGKYTPSTFIFVLKSINLGRISEKNIQINGQLYEPYDFQINVKNNFPTDATFNIEVISIGSKITTKNLYCTTPVVKVKKDENVSISFVFFPFVLETHKFQILFKDPKVGEFQYDLTAIVDMPQVIGESMKFNQVFFTNKSYAVQLVVPQKNEDILRARKQVDAYIQKINRKTQSSQLTSQGKKAIIMQIEKNAYPTLKSETYSLSLVPQTDMVTLKNTSLTIDPEEDESSSTVKKIYLDINMKMPAKEAPIYLVMKNSSASDIRCYKVLINSVFKPLRYELEMKVPVNQSVTQPLPLINISGQVNLFNVTFTTTESAMSRNVFTFNNQKDIPVKAKDQSLVQLTFAPKIQQNYTGLLKIENITVGQVVQYEVNAMGEEPVAEFLKFEQKTGEIKKYELKLPFSRPQKCTVTKCTFPIKNIKYEKNFSYSSESNCYFRFQFLAKIPGPQEGKIYIEDEMKIHAFNIHINVTQNVEGIIEIRSTEREKKDTTINLEKGTWVVQNFDSSLIIPEQIDMPDSGPFTFSYFGSKAGYSESQLVLKSETAGYLKYLLKVWIQQQPQMVITGLKAELGKSHTFVIKLENPDNNSITVTGACSNIQTFFYQPEGSFTVGPKSSKEVKFVYRPTCLQTEVGKICFTSNNNLKWKYELSGNGCLQNQQEVKQIDAHIGEEIVQTITFVNPFKKSVFVYIMLENEDGPFKLINKNCKQSLEYLQQIEVPIKFVCTQAKKYSCRVKILINEKIFWRFVIDVRTIFKSDQEVRSFKLLSRGKKQLTTSFVLPYLPKSIKPNEKFKCILTTDDPNLQPLLKTTCRIVKDWETITDNRLSFLLNFLSYKPFICPFNFEIYQQNNCKWIFKGEIEYTTPHPDDQFEIITDINKATSVMFRLNNRVKSHAKFKAYFTSDSDMEFSIFPKSGDLEPYGREGSQFEVTFAPTQYRNSWHGKIIIETEDSFWSYVVKGNLPHYFPPIGKSSLAGSTTRRV